ncbi:MAG: hypothetical protein Q7R30_20335 [Acidobacteriota bacterium]|nr:hypothetical protein [Acidobacteriota bacterium]
MIRFASGIWLLALGAAACSPPAPPPASTTAREIAALEKQLKERPAPPAEVASPPLVAQGSAVFARQADEAMRLVDARLGGSSPKRDEAQYDADVEDSRKSLTELRSSASTEAEKNVAILLTAMMVKQRERHLILLTKPQDAGETRALEHSSTECLAEAEEWIKAIRGEVEILEAGRCLKETQEALRRAQD